ncbi:ABC-F family ATP-binding cassette domain-containing protein [Acholeplasma equirhinis]|uniref:ABC-F family ATP-binding cassette domain-containing protein n=1 Tax=Acholeplasma equirhinis TaxID=555393 RepID=UPI00197A993E|nr:ABC-F family ATP-binding cassette domain-containing protein [Acholeplasma equirhinis]MBN3490125.1 ABC-F family ATP-binding cassette domain-containing protein [Acholeplasma equirhinis]
MLNVSNVTYQIGKDILFEDVNIKFTEGNCYGVIGANGAGKSTLLKLLSGKLQVSKGTISYPQTKRMSVLEQDHFKYDNFTVMETVLMGNQKLFSVMKEKEAIYMKEDFTDADGVRAGELEELFDQMNGWNAESDAAILLSGLGVEPKFHYEQMANLEGNLKVKVLLARAIFDNPDILLLDEPTNHLDIEAVRWLENFLIDFENTVIVVSHDRYFLNKVCTHIVDIDYKTVNLFAGNYDFWYESSQLMLKQMKEQNKKSEEKIKELQDFISRFSANASKSKQATSRKKLLDKIELNEIKPSTRRYPYINFKIEKPLGDDILKVENLTKTVNGKKILDNISFTIGKEDKIVFVGLNQKAHTMLFDIIAGKETADSGVIRWGQTTNVGYFEKDHNYEFTTDTKMVDWLTDYSPNKESAYVRGFLGRMLFSGDDALKSIKVLSGGEKVRLLMSRMMILSKNVLILDEPTNHLDMETITALNKGLQEFQGVVLFTTQDHQLASTVSTKLFEVKEDGKLIEHIDSYETYLETL